MSISFALKKIAYEEASRLLQENSMTHLVHRHLTAEENEVVITFIREEIAAILAKGARGMAHVHLP